MDEESMYRQAPTHVHLLDWALDWDWGEEEEDPVKSVTPRFLAYGVPWKCTRRGTCMYSNNINSPTP